MVVLFLSAAFAKGQESEKELNLPRQVVTKCSDLLLSSEEQLNSLVYAATHEPLEFITRLAERALRPSKPVLRELGAKLGTNTAQWETIVWIEKMPHAAKVEFVDFMSSRHRWRFKTESDLDWHLRHSILARARNITTRFWKQRRLRAELFGAIKKTSIVNGMLAWDTPEQKSASAKVGRLLENFEKFQELAFSTEETNLTAEALEAWKRRLDELFGGHNQLLERIIVTGSAFFIRGRESSLANIVADETWNKRLWWYHSVRSGPPRVTHITGSTSRSPLASLHGGNARRMISWSSYQAFLYPGSAEHLDLERIRIATNYTVENGRRVPRSMEIMVYHHQWLGFYFERVDGRWFPSRSFQGRPIEAACVSCHKSEKETGQLSPRPHFLKSIEDFKKVGYMDPSLIERLLEF